jgi:hypothetical protein
MMRLRDIAGQFGFWLYSRLYTECYLNAQDCLFYFDYEIKLIINLLSLSLLRTLFLYSKNYKTVCEVFRKKI